MRLILTLLFLLLFQICFTQDTMRYGKDIVIYKEGKVIQKEFSSSQNFIKIVFEYNNSGILIRRWWYDKNGKLLSVTLDN